MKNFAYPFNSKTLIGLLLLSIPLVGSAQGELPCNDADPFNSACPLDTWVLILVIAAGIFTAIQLRRKQKSLRA